MKAVQITKRDHVEFVDVPTPEPPAGHALIRPKLFSLCASDIWMLRYGLDEDYPMPPGASGHEMIGVVEALNGEHPEVSVGDLTLTIVPHLDGMSEYYVAPFGDVLPLPEGVSAEHLVQAQQLGTVLYAAKQLPNIVGKNVVVIGQGSAGLWWNTVLKRMGARRVIGIDLLAHRLAVSEQFGATDIIQNTEGGDSAETTQAAVEALLNGELADVVIEAVGEDETINLALDLAKFAGFVLQFGVPHSQTLDLNFYTLFRKCLNLKAIVYATMDPEHECTRIALDMIANGDVPTELLLTHRFPFEEVPAAYELQANRGDGAIKILIDMPDL